MAKNKTEIHVTTVFDGELDATDVFVSLIAQKYSQRNRGREIQREKLGQTNVDRYRKSDENGMRGRQRRR